MDGLLKYFWEKVILVIPACFLTFTQSQEDIIFGIFLIVLIDTILGVWVALKYRVLSSHHLSRVFNKIGVYGLAMASVWVITALEPKFFDIVFRYTGLFIILTELFSNMEKLALLGFQYPVSLLARVNKQFMEFLNSSNKESIGEDILKNRSSLQNKETSK
jgi:hypothetical protein